MDNAKFSFFYFMYISGLIKTVNKFTQLNPILNPGKWFFYIIILQPILVFSIDWFKVTDTIFQIGPPLITSRISIHGKAAAAVAATGFRSQFDGNLQPGCYNNSGNWNFKTTHSGKNLLNPVPKQSCRHLCRGFCHTPSDRKTQPFAASYLSSASAAKRHACLSF